MSVVRAERSAVRCRVGAGLLLALAAAVPPLTAQEAPPPQMILNHVETVKPPMLEEYLESSKEFFEFVEAHRDAMPTFQAQAFQTDEYEFLYALPLESFAQMDGLMAEFMAMEAAGGEEWRRITKAGAAAMQKVDDFVVLLRSDLSYQPAEARVPLEEATAYRWDFYYLQPEMALEAEAIAKDVAALYREKGIKDSYFVFQGLMGSDLPYLVVSIPGKSPADIATRLAEIETTLGESWAPIQARIDDATRAFVSKIARPRPDLSLAPPAPEPAEEE